MPVWKVCIRPDPEAPDLAQGYVLAADREDAFATVDHPFAEVFEAGSDSWAGDGFVDAPSGEIWLSEDMPNRNLAGVLAHETLHAIKHCSRTASVETEIEAGEFGDRVAEQWALAGLAGRLA